MFKAYSDGVFNDSYCNGKLNHSALAVGYDLSANPPYIEVKNAWSPNWGDDGYYKL